MAADERDGRLDAVAWAWLQCGWLMRSPNALAVALITSAAAMRPLSTRLRLETRRFWRPMWLSGAVFGAREPSARRNESASSSSRVHGVASLPGGTCYATMHSDRALLASVHSICGCCERGIGVSDAMQMWRLTSEMGG